MKITSTTILTMFILIISLGSGFTAAQDLRAIADKMCDEPENITGHKILETNLNAGPCIVWDGSAYGIAWSVDTGTVTTIFFARVAADGTLLVGPNQVCSSPAAGSPAISWSGTEYGIVWVDTQSSDWDIYFVSVNKDGFNISGDIQVTTNTSVQLHPYIVWTGSEYGVCYEDYRNGNMDIYFVLLDSAGNVIGSEIQVTTNTAEQQEPSLCWIGTGFCIAWSDYRNTFTDVYCAILDTDGTVIYGDIQITNASANQDYPNVVWTGTEIGIAWDDARDGDWNIYFNILMINGSKLLSADVQITPDTNPQYFNSLVWTGAEYGLIWEDYRNSYSDIYFTRINQSGVVQGGEYQLTTTPSDESNYRRNLAFGTLGYGLGIKYWAEIYYIGIGCHYDTTAPPCPANVHSPSQSYSSITISWNASHDLDTELAYYTLYRNGQEITKTTDTSFIDTGLTADTEYNYLVTATNALQWESSGCNGITVSTPTPPVCSKDVLADYVFISDDDFFLFGMSVTWDGSAYGLCWPYQVGASYDLKFARMAADGTTLLVDPVTVTSSTGISDPVIVWTGTEYGLVWTDYRLGNLDIYFTRLDANGTKLGSDVQVTYNSSGQFTPSLVWTGSQYGLAYTDDSSGDNDVYFTRLDSNGGPLMTELQVTIDSNNQYTPQLVWSGLNFGLVWQDTRNIDYDIYFILLSEFGSPVGSEFSITPAEGDQYTPSLVFTGTEYGVTWNQWSGGGGYVVFNRLDIDGVLLGEEIQVSALSSSATPSVITWNGHEYGIVWQEYSTMTSNLYFNRLDVTGIPLGSSKQITSTVANDWLFPRSMASGDKGYGLFWDLEYSYEYPIFAAIGCPDDVTPPSCPESPTEINRTDTSVQLAWGQSQDLENDIAFYEIVKDGVVEAITTNLSWTDTSFDPTDGSVYWINAVNALEYYSYDCDTVDTSDTVLPTCPENLMAINVTTSSVDLAWLPGWDALSGLELYRIYRDSVLLDSVPAGTLSYHDSTISPDTTYNYVVTSVDFAGNEQTGCDALWISTLPITLTMTKNQDGFNANLDWNDVGLNEYRVYRAATPNVFSELKRVNINQTTDCVLQDGVKIWFYYIQQKGM